MSLVICPSCQRPVNDADAVFCAGCGAPLMPTPEPVGAPTTIELSDALPSATAGLATQVRADNRIAALMGVAGAAVTVIGAFQVWLRIRIAGFAPPGSAETGWKGGDGRTIVVAAAVAAVAAAGLFLDRRDLGLKVALLVTGGVSIVIAAVNMVDAGSKGRDIEVQFGIPAGDVHAQVGIGLYLVMIGGLGLLASGLRARTTSS